MIHLLIVASPGKFISVSSVLFLACSFIHDSNITNDFKYTLYNPERRQNRCAVRAVRCSAKGRDVTPYRAQRSYCPRSMAAGVEIGTNRSGSIRPWDISSKKCYIQGMTCPTDILSKGKAMAVVFDELYSAKPARRSSHRPARLYRMDTVPAYVGWRACTGTPLSRLS